MWKWLFSQREWEVPEGMKLFRSYGEMSAERIQKLEQMAFEHGRYFDSYVVTEPNRQYLWGRDDCGVIGLAAVGRYLHVTGGMIVAEDNQEAFLDQIVEFAEKNKLTVSFFGIDEFGVDMFRSHGFQVTRFGVDCRIPLGNHKWTGKAFQWVRRQVNFVERQGIRLQEWKPEDMDAAEWDRRIQLLTDVSDQHLAGKPQKESIPFFECELIPGYTFRRRVFVAVHPDNPDHVEAFVLCNPIADGREWAIEMYRQRTDAVRGAIPFMMSQVIDQLQAEGCRQVSICPVPTIGCEERLPGDCTVVQKSLLLWRKYLSSFFDIKGLYHFKSRFRPDMHPIHVCAYPRSSFLAMLAYMELVRMSNVKPLHVLKNLLFGDSQRRTLSKPDKNPAPVVRPAVASHPVVSKSTSRSGVTTS